jgi:hypothetical protein
MINRAHIVAVATAASDLNLAARELLAAEADLRRFANLLLRTDRTAWPEDLQQALDQRVIDARWRYDHNVAALRRLTTKEPA